MNGWDSRLTAIELRVLTVDSSRGGGSSKLPLSSAGFNLAKGKLIGSERCLLTGDAPAVLMDQEGLPLKDANLVKQLCCWRVFQAGFAQMLGFLQLQLDSSGATSLFSITATSPPNHPCHVENTEMIPPSLHPCP